MCAFIEQNYGHPNDKPFKVPVEEEVEGEISTELTQENPGVFRPNARGGLRRGGIIALTDLAREKTRDMQDESIPFDGEEERDWDDLSLHR